MFEAAHSPFLVPFDGSFRIPGAPTSPLQESDKHKAKKALRKRIKRLRTLQDMLYAQNEWSMIAKNANAAA